MASSISIIIEREYLERVKKKSFIITTLLMPVLMLLAMALPTLIMYFTDATRMTVAVTDESGVIAPALESNSEVAFTTEKGSLPVDSLLAREGVDAVMTIPADIVDNRKAQVKLYSADPTGMKSEMAIAGQLNDIIEKERMKRYDIENLDEILDQVSSNISITTIKVSEESEDTTSSTVSFILGMAMAFILYMFLMMYGQMVMTSIIEEKSNRVLELIVTSVKPMQLMLGKIAGIALVAVTQIILWCVLIGMMSAFLLPMFITPEMATEIQAYQAGNLTEINNVEIVSALSMMSSLGDLAGIVGLMALYLILGFLLYAAIFAAIGSSVDNVNDASQLTSIAVFPLIFGFLFGIVAGQDPNSGLAFWSSLIPFTSPMVMMSRVPYGVPGWEIAVSVALLVLCVLFFVWLAGKIFRIGIFMYGKKPNIKEICRWITYK